jgi:hypothetical protein
MASVIQVANRALTKLGSARITSLSDDVKAARSISSCFEDLRDDELRAHRWQFAMKRTTLAALADAPAFGYNYQYALPSDFLRIDMVDDRFPAAIMDNYIDAEYLEWTLEGNVILTDIAAPLKLRYIAQITDPTLWDENFREALASRIAMEIAEDLTQSESKKASAAKDYDRSIRQAIRINSIERPAVMPPDNSWVISRI